MGQVSSTLRRAEGGYMHWCPGCEEVHVLPDRWTFNGDLDSPTFTPSFRHSGLQTLKVNGRWTGEWVLDSHGKQVPICLPLHIDRRCTQFLFGQHARSCR